jgi:hypothetical protein
MENVAGYQGDPVENYPYIEKLSSAGKISRSIDMYQGAYHTPGDKAKIPS